MAFECDLFVDFQCYSCLLSGITGECACPSVSLRSVRAGALVASLGPLVSAALYQPSHGVLTGALDEGGQGCTVSLLSPLLTFTLPLCSGSGWLSFWCTGRSSVFSRGLSLGNQACWPDWVVHFALFSVEKLQEA